MLEYSVTLKFNSEEIMYNTEEFKYTYSRTRLRRTRLGNNKKYVLTEVRLIRVHR